MLSYMTFFADLPNLSGLSEVIPVSRCVFWMSTRKWIYAGLVVALLAHFVPMHSHAQEAVMKFAENPTSVSQLTEICGLDIV